MTRHLVLSSLVVATAVLAADKNENTLHTWKKIQLSDQFWGEGANFGDFNKDGNPDVVSGPYWYEGPDFKTKHEYYPATKTFKLKQEDGSTKDVPGFEGALGKNNAYSDNFFAWTHDFNKDGYDDILIYGFPGLDASWYQNPGKAGQKGHWQRHKVLDVVDNESPMWGDVTGDGKPEIVCNSGGYFGFAEPDWSAPEKPWKFRRITPKGGWQRFTHGMGFGDVNNDGRMDFLEKDGWWEQPASIDGDPEWKKHKFTFGTGGAQMYAYDVNGDGRNDVITSLAAHGYGLAWYESLGPKDGEIQFKEHIFMNKEPRENKYGVKFSQLHAIDLVDIDGDGLKDIVTGKRFWAHGPTGDAEPNAASVLYWFRLVRGQNGSVDFVPYLIDDNSGVGTQVIAAKVRKGALPDIVVGNKRGTFVFIHDTKTVSKAEWEKAQPKPFEGNTAAIGDEKKKQLTEAAGASIGGVVPVGKDGKALNLGFEDGTLNNWKAEGKAFEKMPLAGDVVNKRRKDYFSKHEGNYWIGTYEINGDTAEGTLTSESFKVTHPYATFLVAGGPYEDTRVEIVSASDNKVIYKTTGYPGEKFRTSNNARENMVPMLVDLRQHQNKEIFIRLVDKMGGHWGHLNFDDFRFHTTAPEGAEKVAFAALKNENPLPVDDVKFSGLTAEQAAREITMPKGFSAHLFAGEPDVQQPIAFALDDRGRTWVAEGFTYPRRAPEGQGKDRILIFEDTNGDGKFDIRKVFAEGLNLVSGLEVGFGGVWVGAAPYLMFIADRNNDDKPDGEPEILLDGWAWQDTHETLNTFTWGPDGWLYGCHGVFTHSNVGKPGAAKEDRQRLNAGIWRYHPVKQKFEVFAEGTSNPWGIDFNDHGQALIEACVIPHFFHIIQGARYHRQAGTHFNPYVFDDIKTIADHVHYAGDRGPHAGNARSDSAGGGHAHAGLMVYLGNSWPEQYRGSVFMGNIHGQRLNLDTVERKGSGYVGKHGPDFLNFNDKWSQAINFMSDQDGSMYIIDWYDKNQCHHNDINGHDRSNGRIFKIVYNNQKMTKIDLAKATDSELVQHQLNKNDWYVRHARRLLQERAAAGKLSSKVHDELKNIVSSNSDATRQLRAMWALQVTGGFSEDYGLSLLDHKEEYVRSWAIQLLFEDAKPSDKILTKAAQMAKNDSSPVVRLYLASAMQRTPVEKRSPVLEGLVARAEDAKDHNLPLMYWYATEGVVGSSPSRAAGLLVKAKIPLIREYITRRMTAGSKVASAN